MLPELDETLVMNILVDKDGMENDQSYTENWVRQNLEDAQDIANDLALENVPTAVSDIDKLLSDVIDSLTEEYYQETKKVAKDILDNEEINKDETIEQPMDVRMPSAASLEGWVSDGLSYDGYIDDFVSQKLDEVFDEVRNDYPNADVGLVRTALANYYHENSESAWHDNSIAADDAIMFVEDELDDMED